MLGEGERRKSSNYRELREIQDGILANGRKLQRKTVRRKCNNWATRKIVKLGSMKEDCHIVAIRIEEPCRKWKNKLDSFWISRESEQIEYCNMLAQLEKVLAKSSQIFLRPLLILPIQGCILTSVEMSVDPPKISQRLPSLPVLWPLLIFPV